MPQLGAMSWASEFALESHTSSEEDAVMQMTFNDAGNFLSHFYSLYYFEIGTPIVTAQPPYAEREGIELNAERAQARLENEILKG